jgi:hypothetical protein
LTEVEDVAVLAWHPAKMARSKLEVVPEDEGRLVWDAAVAAHQQGQTLFECAVIVGFTTGSALGLGGKKSTANRRFDPGLFPI